MRFSPLVACVPLALAAAVPTARPAETQYPFPYRLPTAEGIAADLGRVREHIARGFPDGRTPYAIDPLAAAPAAGSAAGTPASPGDSPLPAGSPSPGDNGGPTGAAGPAPEPQPAEVLRQLAAGPRPVFGPLDYTTGVIYTGLLRAGEATGDPAYRRLLERELGLLRGMLAAAETAPALRRPLRAALAPAALDDCGAMTAALLRCRRAGIGPDLSFQIDRWADFIRHRQFRLPDGTLARQRPQPVSLWADDYYMGAEPLAELGRLPGGASDLDDAVRDSLQTAQRLFRPERGLFAHGWSEDSPGVPDFYWGRANGWAAVTLCDLLDAMPENHPRRAAVLQLLQDQLKGVASLQSGEGRWHQLLDRPDSYLETSCSAMFVYALAHAIDRGWIPAPTYGPIALAGWLGVAAQITAAGEVDQACIGTTYAGDALYYYHRPANANAAHGYGPVLLAGSEMIGLLQNRRIRIEFKNQAFHFVPSSP